MNNCMKFYFHQPYVKVPVAPGTLQRLVLSVIRALAILAGTLCLTEASICNFLVNNKAKHFSVVHWPLDIFFCKTPVQPS